MVIILSDRKSINEKEITEILKNYGALVVSDKQIISGDGFTVIIQYKKADIKTDHATVLMLSYTDRFDKQTLPSDVIGICEEQNKKALCLFKENNVPVISCGMGNKNTVTVSSIEANTMLVTLQRTVKKSDRNFLYPEEIKIKLKNKYTPFSVMAAALILLLEGIKPTEF